MASTVDLSNRSGDAVHLRNLLARWAEEHKVSLISATPQVDCPDGLDVCVNVSSSLPLIPPTAGRFLKALAKTVKLRFDRKYDLLYVRHDLLGTGTLGTLGATSRRVLEVNGALIEEHYLRGSLSDRMARTLMAYENIILSLADCVICVSPRLAKRLVIRGVNEEAVFVVQNGCDTSKFTPHDEAKAKLKWSKSHSHIGFVGSLTSWCGLEQVIKAMVYVTNKRPQARLIVVGDGKKKAQFRRSMKELDLGEHIQFIGSIPHDEVPIYMSAFDVGTVLKHPDIPGSPLKLFEYLACGTPVVATDDEDFVLLDRENVGCRADYNDPQDIANSICSLLNADEAVSSRARTVALDHSWDQVAADVLTTAENC